MEKTRQKPPYFVTRFSGPVGTVSDGAWQDGWTRRAYVDFGPYRVRQLLAPDQMGSAIREASNDPDAVFGIGRYLFWRWALSVTSDGHTERHGLLSFLFHSMAITVLFAIVGTVLALIWGVLGWISFGLWVAHMYMNVSARSGSTGPPERQAAEGSGAA